MTEYTPRKTRLEELAQLIEQDIARRGLRPGDRYLTAHEVGERFDIHPRQANRAMNILADRDLLQRRAAVGTVVGDAASRFAPHQANIIQVMVGVERLNSGLRTDSLQKALLAEIPGTEIKFNILPERLSAKEIHDIFERRQATGIIYGIVLLGCERSIQEAVASRHIPAVVFGTVFPTASRLSSLDLDQHRIGALLAENLIQKGHRRLAMLIHQTWLSGDNAFLDGIHTAIAESGLPMPPPTIRACAIQQEIVAPEIRALLDSSTTPDAVICRGPALAAIARQTAPDLAIGYDDPDPQTLLPGVACSVVPSLSFQEQARQIGQLLRSANEVPGAPPEHRTVAVQLT